MSTFAVEIVKVGKIGKHPNADNLSITQMYSYPVIFKTGELIEGDIAVYFPIDSVLPDLPIFQFMWKDKTPTEWHRTVKAVRLRGIFSMGLLMPLSSTFVRMLLENGKTDGNVGDNISKELGVYKYEPPEEVNTRGECEKQPDWFVHYTDIEAARKYANNIFVPGEEIIVTEKIHGANARFAWHEDRLWVGSHRLAKKFGGDDIWNKVAQKINIEYICKDYPGFIFIGELYGQVQGGWNYGLPQGKNSFVLFDIYDIQNGRYIDHDKVETIAKAWTPYLVEDKPFVPFEEFIPMVPIIHKGPWESIEKAEEWATGPSLMPEAKNIREGVVIKSAQERWNEKIGRVILKLHNPDFLIATGKRKSEGPAH